MNCQNFEPLNLVISYLNFNLRLSCNQELQGIRNYNWTVSECQEQQWWKDVRLHIKFFSWGTELYYLFNLLRVFYTAINRRFTITTDHKLTWFNINLFVCARACVCACVRARVWVPLLQFLVSLSLELLCEEYLGCPSVKISERCDGPRG
jgi:hypothetical protein